MKIQIITIPYDSGYRGLRMGRGPLHFLEGGLQNTLRETGYEVTTLQLESKQAFRTEVSTAFELNNLLSNQLSVSAEPFPLILSGNCNLTLGALASAGTDRTGLLWFDAHGDYNTPETTSTGFFDGMGLAVITGQCWQQAARTVTEFSAVPAQHVIHVGGRDFDTGERERMEDDGIAVIHAASIRQHGAQPAVTPALETLRSKVDRIHIHVDLDVLDPKAAQANHYAVPDGLTVEQVSHTLTETGRQFQIVSATFSAYDPDYDQEDRVLNAGLHFMQTVLQSVQQ